MILGIGTDLANIERIEATIARFGTRFIDRVFTPREQAKAQSRAHGQASTYAKRWAAKEACSKALGTGLRMGIAWKDMAVSNLRSGQPVMHLTGWAAERLAQMTPPGHRAVVHVTLTDDHPWAQAFVVIEAVPLATPDLILTSPSNLNPAGLNPTGSNPTDPNPASPNPATATPGTPNSTDPIPPS
jgi:holo-[acyl-carrier protein] synthase